MGRAEQDERADSLRVLGSQLEGNAPAERRADDHGLVDSEIVEEVQDVVGVGIRSAGQWRLAESAQVGRNDPMGNSEPGNDASPHASIRHSGMQQDDGGPTALVIMSEEQRAHPVTLIGGRQWLSP